MTAEAVEFDGVPPAFVHRPPRASSLLPKVERVCRTVDRILEPEQALAVDVITGLKADGSPASLSGAVISARQNLKTFVIEDVVLTRLVDPTDPSRLFVWTSQSLDTCQETFLHFVAIFDSKDYPHMRRRLAKISSGKGSEEIELRDGKRLKFKARSAKSGQGLTGDVVVLDEAFALEPAHMASLIPTLSTRRRATVIYGSSAGHPASEVLRGVRDRGRAGGRGAPAYVEWCAPGSWEEPGCELANCRHTTDMPGCVLDSREYIQLANPMAGRRITWEYLADERRDLPPAEFARERLGWWDEPEGDGAPPISLADWKAQTDNDTIPEFAGVVFAAEIAMDRKSSSIGVAGWREDGAAHVELIWQGDPDRLLPELLELLGRHTLLKLNRGTEEKPKWHDAVIVDPGSPANTLLEPLKRSRVNGVLVKPVEMTTREVSVAASGLQDALREKTVWHRSQPTVDAALVGAVKRDLGDGGWAFGRRKSAKESVDITPAVVLTNARWALTEAAPAALPRIF